MWNLLFSSAEKIINAYLNLDEESAKSFQPLTGKTLRVEILDWNIQFTIKITDKIHLLPNSTEPADVSIRAHLSALLKIMKGKGVFINKDMQIEGDALIAQSFRDAWQRIDIDWEEQLSHFLGDALAHQVCFQFKRANSFGARVLKIFQNSAREFFQEEYPLFPSQIQLQEFYNDVDELRDDVERMEMRINRLIL